MDWYFLADKTGAFNPKDPTASTVSSQGALSHHQIFEREANQNSLDNATGNGPVTIRFRIIQVSGGAKQDFLNALHFSTLKAHLQAARNTQMQSSADEVTRYSDPQVVGDLSVPLTLLYVEDFGTRGLIGPGSNREAHAFPDQFPKPHCFLGLCRNVGDSQKGDLGGGGTYGFGKSVLWKHSGIGTVIFHSRLSTPSFSHATGEIVDVRLFGQCRLPSRWIGNDPYKDEGYFGISDPEQVASPLHNADATAAAASLGFVARQLSESGTSILVVDMRDPDDGEPISDLHKFAREMKDAAERFFWPAIVDNRVSVEAVVQVNGKSEVLPALPQNRSDVKPFIPAYTAASNNTKIGGVDLKEFEIEIPPGPNKVQFPKAMKARIGVATVLAENEGEPEDYRNRAALIRGAGMVVGYVAVTRKGLNAKDFYAVVVGGRAVPASGPGADTAQNRCEHLLALAEPVTHDKWTEKSDQLKGWRGAGARIKEILFGLGKLVTEMTCQTVTPEGEAAPEIAKYFPLDEGNASGTSRDMSVEVIDPGSRSNSGSNQVQRNFHVRVVIPAESEFEGKTKPTGWRIECKFGFIGESKSARIVDPSKVRFTQRKHGSAEWSSLDTTFENLATFAGSVSNEEQICELRGISEEIDAGVDAQRRYALQVSAAKSIAGGESE